MPRLRTREIEIEYDSFGDPSGRPLLLIMGLGAQMIFWEEGFCEALAERGHYVVRFDNRDVGLSTKLEHLPPPSLPELLAAATGAGRLEPPYTLDDMAEDAAGVLTELGLADAHVCGASMGGMIAQMLAVRHPKRVRSLISVMSTTGDPSLPVARPEAMATLVTPQPTERDAMIEYGVRVWRVIGSPGVPFEEDRVRSLMARAFERGIHPEGFLRQLAAILAHGSRREALRSVTAPTLVIHGSDDPLVPVEGGRDTAECIPGAELLEIPGMGHDLPRALWPRLVSAISEHTEKAERR